MKASFLVLAVCAVALLATASPALAENRADLRGAVQAADAAPLTERLARHEAPRWAELRTQANASSDPCCAPEPCCPPSCCWPYEAPCGDPCKWVGTISVAAWLTGATGDLTVRGRDAEVDQSLGDTIDTLDTLESFYQGVFTLYRGKWGFRLAGQTLRFEDSTELESAGGSVTGGFGIDSFDATIGYCLKRCPVQIGCGTDCPSTVAYEVYAGIRYFSAQISLDATAVAGPVRKEVKDWLDPIVGTRISWDLGNRWLFDFQADIGGFGVGSDLTWSLRLGATYRFARIFSMSGGLKTLDVDYSDGSGTDRFKWDVNLWGPYITFNFHF